MLNKYILTGTLAAACSATIVAAQGQQPQPAPQPQPSSAAQAAAESGSTTVIGCVYRERDVPGRAPNVAERVGVLEDYILMEVPGATATGGATAADSASPAAGANAPAAGAQGRASSSGAQAGAPESAQATAGRDTTTATGTTGTTGAAKMGRMYKLELASDDRLQTLVGRRVEVMGKVDAEEGDSKNTAGAATSTTDAVIGRDRVNLSEFEVSSIREIAGTCPTLTGN